MSTVLIFDQIVFILQLSMFVSHKSGEREAPEVAVVGSVLTVNCTIISLDKVLTTHRYWLV